MKINRYIEHPTDTHTQDKIPWEIADISQKMK